MLPRHRGGQNVDQGRSSGSGKMKTAYFRPVPGEGRNLLPFLPESGGEASSVRGRADAARWCCVAERLLYCVRALREEAGLFIPFDRRAVQQGGFLPSRRFLGALAYIRGRRACLSGYLDDPQVLNRHQKPESRLASHTYG